MWVLIASVPDLCILVIFVKAPSILVHKIIIWNAQGVPQ